MSAGGDRKDWRGGRAASERWHPAQEAEQQPEPGWRRKRPRGTPTVSGRRPWRKILLANVFLCILVSIAVWLFKPPVNHQFLMLVYEGGQTILPDGVPVWHGVGAGSDVELPVVQRGVGVDIQRIAGEADKGVSGVPAQSTQLLQTLEKGISYGRLTSETVVLFIQTGAIRTGPQDAEIRLLPRLGPAAAWDVPSDTGTTLTALKDGLVNLLQKRPRAAVLLLLDLPQSPHDWRIGLQDQHALEQIQAWVNEPEFKERLVIVQSSAPGQSSWPLGQDGNGQTTFANRVFAGIQGVTRDLKIRDYVTKLKDETEKMVEQTRGKSLQTVVVTPAIRNIGAVGDRYMLLGKQGKSIQSQPDSTKAISMKLLQERLQKCWQLTQQPGDWPRNVEITGILQDAERALLAGAGPQAEQLLVAAEKLSSIDAGLPSAGSIGTEPDEVRNEPKYPDVVFSSWEEWRKAANWDLPEERGQRLKSQRERAERAVGEMATVAGRLEAVALQAETALLKSEDAAFTAAGNTQLRPLDNSDAIAATELELWESVAQLAKQIKAARIEFWRSGSSLPGLLAWSAAVDTSPVGSAIQNRLSAVVGPELPEIPQLTEQAANDTESQQREVLLDTVLHLTATLRHLQYQLQQTPAPGVSADQLKQYAAELERKTAATLSTRELLEQQELLYADTLLQSSKDLQQSGMVELQTVFHQLLAVLQLTDLPADKRSELLQRLLKLELHLRDKTGDPATVNRPALSTTDFRSLRWRLSGLRLLKQHLPEQYAEPLLQQLAGAGPEDVLQHEQERLLRLVCCACVRSLQAGIDSGAEKQRADLLEDAVFGLSLLPLVDAAQLRSFRGSLQNPASLLTKCWTNDYRKMQGQRFQAGGWMDIKSPATSWYNRMARVWWPDISTVQENVGVLKIEAAPSRLRLLDPTVPEQPVSAKVTVAVPGVPTGISGTGVLRLFPATQDGLLQIQESPVLIGSSDVETAAQSVAYEPQLSAGQKLLESGVEKRPRSIDARLFFRGRFELASDVLQITASRQRKTILQPAIKPAEARMQVEITQGRPVVFLLDWSKSMNDALKNQQRFKSDEAIDALWRIVNDLDTDRSKSLRVFGHRWLQEVGQADQEESEFENERKKLGFELPPNSEVNSGKWTHSSGLIRQQTSKERFRKALDLLKTSGPHGQTPLYEALRHCLENELKGTSGVIIAVTDGSDSTEDPEGRQNLLKSLVLRLQERQQSGRMTKIQLVLFGLDDIDRKQLDEDLQKCPDLKTWMELDTVGNQLEIVRRTIVALAPEPLELWPENAPVREFLPETQGDRKSRYSIATMPGKYHLQLKDTGLKSDELDLQGGDALKISFDWTKSRFVVSKSPSVEKKSRVTAASDELNANIPNWIAQLGRTRRPAQASEAREFDLVLGSDHPDCRYVKQPAEFGVIFKTVGDATSVPMDVNITQKWLAEELGVPGWRLRFSRWPRLQAGLELDVWWKMERTPTQQPVVLSAAELRQREAGGEWRRVRVGESDVEYAGSYRPEGRRLEIELRVPDWDQLADPEQQDRRRKLYGMRVEVGEGSREGSAFRPGREPQLKETVLIEHGRILYRFEYPEDQGLREGTDVEFGITTEAELRKGTLSTSLQVDDANEE